ncbi:MAG: hypothetical protein ACKVT1_07765 [Dehalococcoidia bacterium]
MGMMFGFAGHRRQQLEAELRRMAEELPRLGVERAYLAGDLAGGAVRVESDLEIVLVHETAEPFHRRPDFFTTHLRPCVSTRFIVYTPAEFDRWQDDDPFLRAVIGSGAGVTGG